MKLWVLCGALSIIAGSLIAQVVMASCVSAEQRLRVSLQMSGEVCVSFKDTWLGPHIDKHWQARVSYGVTYCPAQDYPAGIKDGEVGQL